MKSQCVLQPSVIVTSLRQRAHSLRTQASCLQQASSPDVDERLTADLVHEALALEEESEELDRLATQYERRLC
ncbi:hypothetical protein [Terriglobus sp.]|uniref:hypothetical protein n=1 Tax=Terriglobus sp. TaxID=1889013 RepID=UPI003B00DB90